MPNLINYYDSPTTSAINQPIKTLTWSNGVTIDHSNHNVYTLSVTTGSGSIVHSNAPSGRYGFELHLNWTGGAITFPGNWTGDSAPDAIGDYVITGVTIDGGTSWKIAVLVE